MTDLVVRARLQNIVVTAVAPALAMLPKHMNSAPARMMLLAIGMQESRFLYRYQLVDGGGKGPARSFWQCEQGTRASRGGVWGVYLHNASSELLQLLCRDRDVSFNPAPIWLAIETDDILAAGVARLLLWTNALPLPHPEDIEDCWDYYQATWRPGKPKHDTWAMCHAAALDVVYPPAPADSPLEDTDL